MNWKQFSAEAPDLAQKGEALLEHGGVLLLGTVRKDGSPRISPVEPLLLDGELFLGMMWKSLKAADLLRDPRCTIHNLLSDRHAKEGEFKLHGRARSITDAATRKRYGAGLEKKIGWSPEGMQYHLFAIEVESAGLFLATQPKRTVIRWRAGQGVATFEQGID